MSSALQQLSDESLERLVGIHSSLSPESLTGDGELPPEVWVPRQKQLESDLRQFAAEHGLAADATDDLAAYSELGRRMNLRRPRRMRP